MFSRRTLISLSQYLDLQMPNLVRGLFEKHGIVDAGELVWLPFSASSLKDVVERLEVVDPELVRELFGEIIRTQGDLRCRVDPRYRYDERWEDLQRCLRLDGYSIGKNGVVPIDPTTEDAPPLDDDLSTALAASGLGNADTVKRKLDQSTEAFRRADFNAALTHARVAMESLARAIAEGIQAAQGGGKFDPAKWGGIIQYLREQEFLTQEEERGLVGVYGFVSPGAHRDIPTDEQEMTRLGRILVVSMCWFLIQRCQQT